MNGRKRLLACALFVSGALAVFSCGDRYPAELGAVYKAGTSGPPVTGGAGPSGGGGPGSCETLYGGVCLPISELASCANPIGLANLCSTTPGLIEAGVGDGPVADAGARDSSPFPDAFLGFDAAVLARLQFDAHSSAATPLVAVSTGFFCCVAVIDAGPSPDASHDVRAPDVSPFSIDGS